MSTPKKCYYIKGASMNEMIKRSIQGFVKIIDVGTGEVLVDTTNDVL